MSRQLLLPELAESVVEGEILKWLVQEGERVELEQPICEVMTDKVTVELPSPYAGILEQQLVPVGAVVAVHAPIALISDAPISEAPIPVSAAPLGRGGEETPPAAATDAADTGLFPDTSLFKVEAHDEVLKVSGLHLSGPPSSRSVPSPPPARSNPAGQLQGGRILAVPAARQLARTLGVDLAAVSGSGPNGRVRPLDVQQHADQGAAPPELEQPELSGTSTAQDAGEATPSGVLSSRSSAPSSTNSGLNVPPVQYRTPRGYEHLEQRVPLRGMRRAIAGQMQASHLYTVRTLTVDEANLSALVGLRARLNAQLAPEGVKLSYLPFVFKAVVAALKKYPSLNTSFDEASGEIVQKRYYHLGMAVTTDAGLTVPVIKDADQHSLLDLGQQVNRLAVQARSNKLTPDELAGSSFSVTNIGSIGALFSFPIINVPDAAILGVHSIVKRPIVDRAGQIVAADMMYLSLSFDHRLVDGAEAARFCKEVIRLLESPELLMVSI